MDTTAFRADLDLIPDTLDALAVVLRDGLPGLDGLPGALRVSVPPERRRVLVLGMGSSAYAAHVVARAARAQGVPVTVELASTSELPAPAEDLVVVAVSATGGSAEVLDAVVRYRGTGRLVAVTNRPDSALAQGADAVVPLGAGTEQSGIACRTFRATLPVLDALLAALTPVTPMFSAQSLRRAAEASRHLLDADADWVPPLADLLGGPIGAWVLAPVERLSSAQQSALMMREVPRRPAYASETGDWSHVDVYLTKTQDYRALVFAGSAWDGPALDWMRQRGSRYAVVGGTLPGAELTVEFPGQEDRSVALLTEVLAGELVAWHWFREA
ncbi:SIS domain-containing protein [Sediminivirga luteola]|uniref:Glutamine--fructose-6-phosphate aminotransferase [isomerizing] n=1 Tax=Sediminivirga luteola TaxID=1774748 RepID=A0A8J2TXM5_9MICO|nr:SIS domain-containing protein [Sediminivirga luteola]GGA13023.1 sigma factor regulator FecR [Sediminivirga luteola]